MLPKQSFLLINFYEFYYMQKIEFILPAVAETMNGKAPSAWARKISLSVLKKILIFILIDNIRC